MAGSKGGELSLIGFVSLFFFSFFFFFFFSVLFSLAPIFFSPPQNTAWRWRSRSSGLYNGQNADRRGPVQNAACGPCSYLSRSFRRSVRNIARTFLVSRERHARKSVASGIIDPSFLLGVSQGRSAMRETGTGAQNNANGTTLDRGWPWSMMPIRPPALTIDLGPGSARPTTSSRPGPACARWPRPKACSAGNWCRTVSKVDSAVQSPCNALRQGLFVLGHARAVQRSTSHG